MKTISKTIIPLLLMVTVCCFSHCSKKDEAPEQTCKTCAARAFNNEQLIKEEQICSDEAENNFRKTYSDYTVACE